jgi:hypothetical protein
MCVQGRLPAFYNNMIRQDKISQDALSATVAGYDFTVSRLGFNLSDDKSTQVHSCESIACTSVCGHARSTSWSRVCLWRGVCLYV